MGRTGAIKESPGTKMTGYIVDGVYYKGIPPIEKMRSKQQDTYKQHDQNRQRKDFSREIIQPYNRDGTPNQDFIQAWPEESKGYGFLPKDEDLKNGKN